MSKSPTAKYQPRSTRSDVKKNRNVPNTLREKVIMLRYAGYKWRDICKRTSLSYSTCQDIWRKQDKDPEMVVRARAQAIRESAAELAEKASEALGCLTKDSLTHDRIEVRDKDGNIIDIKHSGPNGAQIATAYGILRDKSDKLLSDADALESMRQNRELAPGRMKEMVAQLSERIGRLQEVSADLDLSNLTAKIQMIGEAIDDPQDGNNELEADYEVVDEDESPE